MFDPNQKLTGRQYSRAVAFLIIAFVFVPGLVLVSRPAGYLTVLLAFSCSVVCVALAWLNWTRYSQLTIPSVEEEAPIRK